MNSSKYLTFRFDYETHESKLQAILDFIKANCSSYAIFDEVAEKTKKKHIQGKIIPVKSMETFRRQLQQSFVNVFIKSNYSIAKVEKEYYDTYICKDGNIVINNIWTEQEIKDLQAKHIPKQEFIQQCKEKKKLQSWSQKVAEEMEKEIPDVIQKYIELLQFETLDNSDFSCYEFTQFKNAKESMLEFMLDKMGTAVKTLSSSIINGLFYGITNHFLMKSHKRKEWVSKIASKLDRF